MGEVRENLPNGSPRNKIEYLADCIDFAKSQAGGELPKNLLVNPDLSAGEVDINWNLPHYARWTTGMFTYSNQSASEMHLGRSFGRPAPVGWGVEVKAASSYAHSAFYNTIGSEVEKRDPTAKAAFFLMGFGDAKVIHFSVFTAPVENEILYNDENGETQRKDLSYSAYLKMHDDTVYHRFGVVELDQNGDFVDYVGKTFSARPEPAKFVQTWLHGLKFKPGGIYAFFVESDMNNGGKSCAFTGAGVFLNPEQQNIVPDLTPSQPAQEALRCVESLGHLSQAQLTGGVSIDVGRFPMPFGMEKHLIFCNCQTTQTATETPINAATITKTDYKTVRVVGDTVGGQSHGHLMAYYSKTPVHLNYFNSANYQAV
ncbi:hypothetical protein BCT11_14980 [Vibrio sp. 10N.222.52.B12]|uniref:hypothetical protein n=1 Tax=Vibrio sp. 10N.222.52.B12 TaxID=1880840 RepID=UPI000C860445|nr:hypothetical protein [Vibrio sp. 10N.222.52.B12]PMO39592.1 hypothetical protein BCT11_14980 [Vibrio sp. 10N.222.52.B12]